MSRSVRKAIAFITFLAMAIQTFVFSDVMPASAAETTFTVEEWGCLSEIVNPTENVTIPSDTGADYISLYLYNSGIKSLTIKGEYSSVYISAANELEELIIPKNVSSITLVSMDKLTDLKIGNGCDNLYLYNLPSITSVTLPDSLSILSVSGMDGMKTMRLNKGLETYRQSACPNLKVTVPATVSSLSCDDYSLITIDKNNPYFEVYDGSLYDSEKFLVTAADKATLNIKEGTLGIRCDALCGAYAITTINMPDSLLYLDGYALGGGVNVKKLKVSKNLISIQSYAFCGIGADTIKLPSTLEYVDSAAFNGYYGSVSIDGDYSEAIIKDGAGIYKADYYYDYDTEKQDWVKHDGYSLIFYAKNKTKLDLRSDCIQIEEDAINGCPFTTLDVPEGVRHFSARLGECTKLKTINLPASLKYFDDYEAYYYSAPNLQKYTVDSENTEYATYDGCLYSKDKEILYTIPVGKADVTVVRGCVTMRSYCLGSAYYGDYDYDIGRHVTVELPATVRAFPDYYYCEAIDFARVTSGTTSAEWIYNLSTEYRGSWNPITYSFTDTSKEVLSKIAMPDQITLKKGKTTEISYTYPSGLQIVTGLDASYNNTFAKVTFKSTKKKVAKVDKYTGVITGVKKGSATIKATVEMADGTKKTFKIKVKVKK